MPPKAGQVLQAQGHRAQHWPPHWSYSCAPVMHEHVDLSACIWFCPTLNVLCIFPSSELFVWTWHSLAAATAQRG